MLWNSFEGMHQTLSSLIALGVRRFAGDVYSLQHGGFEAIVHQYLTDCRSHCVPASYTLTSTKHNCRSVPERGALVEWDWSATTIKQLSHEFLKQISDVLVATVHTAIVKKPCC
jgi:hypothetical protein